MCVQLIWVRTKIKHQTYKQVSQMMYWKFSELITKIIATDQSHYAEQQNDGSYRKKSGIVNPDFICQELKKEGSFAIYQKNTDLTIKWICFDFDILKSCIESGLKKTGLKELNRTVITFCEELKILEIPFLLEFSGNRGYHIWITFDDPINYHTGYDIHQAILNKASLDFDSELITIDLFPESPTPTGNVGKGVKIPLSKHRKSNYYSYLFSEIEDIKNTKNHTYLSQELLLENIKILEQHNSTNRSELERILGVFFETYSTELIQYNRVKSIKIQKTGFSLADLLTLWKKSPPLKKLSEKIEKKTNLSHSQRKLIVGILCNILCNKSVDFSDKILHEIFEKFDNYDPIITSMAIQSLRSFNFPTQEQIESILSNKFEENLSIEDLIKKCIPKYLEYVDANFEFSNKDIEITRAAELNYLFMNDEVQAKVVIEELSSKDNSEFLLDMEKFINGDKDWGFYRHSRNEKIKLESS